MTTTVYRAVRDITDEEWLSALQDHVGPENAVHQLTLFVRLGGDPKDHDYALLSYRTSSLRKRGVKIGSSRRRGIWLEPADA